MLQLLSYEPSLTARRWVTQRKAFGKPLSSQAVIRHKLALMIARTESVQNWLENLTHQMNNMVSPHVASCIAYGTHDVSLQNYKQQAKHLAGQIGLLKMYSTRCAQETARDAVQIFGGRGITRTGMGRFIEHYHRTVPFDA